MIDEAIKRRKTRNKIRLLRVYVAFNTFLIIVFAISFLLSVSTRSQVHFYPGYQKEDLSLVVEDILAQGGANDEDYRKLLYQTGLGRPAVDDILEDKSKSDKELLAIFNSFQEEFFAPVDVAKKQIGVVTYEERVVDTENKAYRAFEIVDLRDGDILVSKSTHTMGWRHGHAAIVIDEDNRKILEAALYGYNSQISKADSWASYGSFIHLRLKEDIANEKGLTQRQAGQEIAAFAADYLYDIPYGLFSGMPVKAEAVGCQNKTQCAHLVWYPYYQFGFDIDPNGSWMVTPKDIANSGLLEVVQVYGVDPGQLWP